MKNVIKYIKSVKQLNVKVTATRFEPTNFASLAKWSSVRLRTKWLWVRISLLSRKIQIWRLLRARNSLTFRQTIECGFTLKLVRDMVITNTPTNMISLLTKELAVCLFYIFCLQSPFATKTLKLKSLRPCFFLFFFLLHTWKTKRKRLLINLNSGLELKTTRSDSEVVRIRTLNCETTHNSKEKKNVIFEDLVKSFRNIKV